MSGRGPFTLLCIYTSAAAPDACFAELPRTTTCSTGKHGPTEIEPLLGATQHWNEKQNAGDTGPSPTYILQPKRRRPTSLRYSDILLELKHVLCCCTSPRRYKLLTRYRYYQQKKPYTAVSVQIDQLTSESYDEDDLSGIPDLLEVIRLQATGPQELARALRKKLKYGSVHRQLRALTILDGVLQNAGQRTQKTVLDDPPLQERLRIAAIDPLSDSDVREKCKTLFGQWVASSVQQPGLAGAKSLYNQLPRKKLQATQQRREQSRVLQETERDALQDEDDTPPSRPRIGSVTGDSSTARRRSSGAIPISLSSSSTFGINKVKKDKKSKSKTFNLEKERPAILQAIASASISSSNLNNALKLINREHKRVSEDAEVIKRFETCKALRRQILRYIQFVETEELLGGLIDANERLIGSLMAFEILDKSVDDDSDSELEEAAHLSRQEKQRTEAAVKDAEKKLATTDIATKPPVKPPRPTSMKMPARQVPVLNVSKAETPFDAEDDSDNDSDDSNDPFADRNAAPRTPEPSSKAGFNWKEI